MKNLSFILFRLYLIVILTTTPLLCNAFDGADGPYIFYHPDGKARIISINEQGVKEDQIIDQIDDKFILDIVSHNGKHRFQVKLHPIQRNDWYHNKSEKILVLGDPHGNMECFIDVLQANKVIDDQYKWMYENNHLMIVGDIFDRGDDVVQILWLVYKLEEEARKAGGKVSFIYGNHEIMVLANDLRYVNDKYKELAEVYATEMKYSDFFSTDTELGRWLAERNTIEVIGKDLFVHAGLSLPVCDTNLSIPEINQELSQGLNKSGKERKIQSKYSNLLFTTNGPVWYRGLVDATKDQAITKEEDLDLILAHFNAERIIVGHTIFDDITTFFNQKVIAINVNNLKNKNNNKGRGILIENGKTHIIIYGNVELSDTKNL